MATRIRIKRGTESQITGYTGTQYEGELAYATNTGEVFVNNGTQFISVGGSSETPTLQSVTDAGAITTNDITIGTTVLRSGSYLNVKPVSNYGIIVRNSGDDNKYISMGVPGDYGFIKYKENTGSAVTINSTGVGIGTTAPNSLLHVARTSNGEVLRLQDTTNANQNYVFETEATGSYYGLNLKNSSTGDTIVNFSANGKLGIKTNNPDKALTINETADNDVQIKIGNHFGIGYSQAGQTRSVIGSTYGNDAAMMSFVLGGYTTASDKMTILGSGNVGINTATPTQKLDVIGNIKANNLFVESDIYHQGDPDTKFSFTNNSIQLHTFGNERLRITQDGNVGIGTTSPTEKLEVSGNVKVSNGNNNISIIPNNSAGSISTTSQAVQGAIVSAVSDGFTFASRNVYGGVNIGSFNNAGTVTLGAFAYGNVNYQTAHNSFAHTWHGSRASDPWMTLNSTGLGVGTTSPAAKLDVNGTTYLRSVALNTIFGYSGNNIQFINTGNTTFAGNVGIGTTAPAHVLHINKDNPYIQIQDSSAPTRGDMSAGIIMKDSTGAQSFQITQSNSVDVSIRANAGDLSLGTFVGPVIKLDGHNVGIGTTAPAAKLDVRGTISQRVDASITANQYPIQLFNDYSGTDYYLLRQRVVDSGTKVRTGLGITGAPDAAFVLGPQTDETIKFAANGNIINLTDITAADPLRINSGEVRIGDISGSAASYLNVIQGASSTKPALGVKQGVGGSNKMITILDSSGAETMGITSEGGFYFRDNNLVGRFAFEHDYSPAGADGLTVGIDLRTEDASGNLQSLGYIDVTQDDISANESSMRLSVGEGTPTEVMRLQSNGNVGIGTTAPDSKLHVSATSGIAFKVNPNNVDKEWYIDTTNPDHLKKGGNLILNADPTGVHISTKISFNIDGSNKASINSDGDLGIGTTAQTSKVHIEGTAMRQLRIGTAGGPSGNTDTSGAVGDMAYDNDFFYIKTANGWGRVQLDFGF